MTYVYVPPFFGYYFIIHSNETPVLVITGLKILMRTFTCCVPAFSLVEHRCFSLGSTWDWLSENRHDWSYQHLGGTSALATKVTWRSVFRHRRKVEWKKDENKWKLLQTYHRQSGSRHSSSEWVHEAPVTTLIWRWEASLVSYSQRVTHICLGQQECLSHVLWNPHEKSRIVPPRRLRSLKHCGGGFFIS